MSAHKALQGSEKETNELLGGVEGNSICPHRQIRDCFTKKPPEKIGFSGQTSGCVIRRLKEYIKTEKLIEAGLLDRKATLVLNTDYFVVIDFEATCEVS